MTPTRGFNSVDGKNSNKVCTIVKRFFKIFNDGLRYFDDGLLRYFDDDLLRYFDDGLLRYFDNGLFHFAGGTVVNRANVD